MVLGREGIIARVKSLREQERMSIERRCFAWHLLTRDWFSIVGEEKAEAVGSFRGKLKTFHLIISIISVEYKVRLLFKSEQGGRGLLEG